MPTLLALILIGILVAILGGSSYLMNMNQAKTPLKITKQITPMISNTPSLSPKITSIASPSSSPSPEKIILLSDAWNLGTKTYINSKIDITFDYPTYFKMYETDVDKENADWAKKYKNDPNARQPLYQSSFLVSFDSQDRSGPVTQEICENKMSVSVQKYDNDKHMKLYDFIADLHKTYAGDGITDTFTTYKKSLKTTDLPKENSYVFEGIIGENPVKEVYFENNGSIYLFHLMGNCDTGGKYTPQADAVFTQILTSIHFQ